MPAGILEAHSVPGGLQLSYGFVHTVTLWAGSPVPKAESRLSRAHGRALVSPRNEELVPFFPRHCFWE